jgi:lysophospholipase L1-like esterase
MSRGSSLSGGARFVGAVLMAMTAATCANTPTSPSTPAAVASKGSVPQGGEPAPDPLPGVQAVGATSFLAFGDSITFGTLSSFDGAFLFDPPPGTSYPSQLDGVLESSYPVQDFTVVNEGSPGEQAVNAVASGRFAQRMAAVRPQGLLLLEGINDLNGGRSIGEAVGALQQMIEIARLYNTTVLVATMFQTCLSTQPGTGQVRENSSDKIQAFNGAINAMAAGRQNVYVVNLYSAFGDNCGPEGGVNLLGGDGLHPSASGYARIASTFAAAIGARFPVRGSFQ